MSKNSIDSKKIEAAIASAEQLTSGELRVHIESKCSAEPLDRASTVFAALSMHKTEARNGVLIYLSTEDRKFAIIGDAGINKVVNDDFWQVAYDASLPHLKSGDWTTALCLAVEACGGALSKFFPYSEDDVNELEDGISWGK